MYVSISGRSESSMLLKESKLVVIFARQPPLPLCRNGYPDIKMKRNIRKNQVAKYSLK